MSHEREFILSCMPVQLCASKSHPEKNPKAGAIRVIVPEEDEVCVDVDGAVQGREHVGDEEPLSGAHPEHVLHVLPLLNNGI